MPKATTTWTERGMPDNLNDLALYHERQRRIAAEQHVETIRTAGLGLGLGVAEALVQKSKWARAWKAAAKKHRDAHA